MSNPTPTSRLSSALASMKSMGSKTAVTSSPREKMATEIDGRTLTHEQLLVLESGSHKIKVQAFAGTGKTTLLRAFARQSPSAKGLYLAFNNSIAAQGRVLFPANVQCRTHNSAALRELGQIHPGWRSISNGKLDTPRTEHVEAICERHRSSAKWALAVIHRYIYSAERDISEKHFPLSDALFVGNGHEHIDIGSHVESAKVIWETMCDPHSMVPMPHDGCLKLWSLSPRQLPFDYILVDESQDSNPAFLSSIEKQQCRLVYVGDEHQGIYGYRGAVNALAQVTGCEQLHLTETHRFGPRLAYLANKIIASKHGSAILRSSQSASDTEVVFGKAPIGINPLYLARTNAGLFEQALSLSKQSKPFTLVGDIKRFAFHDLPDLLELRASSGQGQYAAYQDLEELRLVAEEQGRTDLAMRARLAHKYGPELPSMLLSINKQLSVAQSGPEDKALCRLSTLHQAKGLESDWVEIMEDFKFAPKVKSEASILADSKSSDSEEANVLYVAITRARHGLAIRSPEVSTWAQSMISSGFSPAQEIQDDSLFG